MTQGYSYCRQMLERITDMVEGVADVKGYDEPARGNYQILCLFRYPVGTVLAIDDYYNQMQDVLGLEWPLKLSVEQAGDGTIIAKISARFKYENGKVQ